MNNNVVDLLREKKNNDVRILRFMRQTVLVGSSPWHHHCNAVLFYLICGGQLLAVGSERDEASGQVDQTADLQVRVGATGGRRAERVPSAHQVAVTPLDTAETMWSHYFIGTSPLKGQKKMPSSKFTTENN